MTNTSLKLPEDLKQLAVAARTEMRKSGKGYSAGEVHAYVQARARGRAIPEPKAKSWRS